MQIRDMSHNRIIQLGENSFQHLAHLHDLLLSHNSVRNLSEKALSGLAKLKTLWVDGLNRLLREQ